MNNAKKTFKRLTGYKLFLPFLCLALVLLINVIKTPTFFAITINNGVFYGYIIDVINRASELVILAVGIVCGAWNGFLVAKMKIQPMVATLILFTAGRGIAQLITDGQMIYVRVDHFKKLGAFIGGVPLPTPVFAAILVVMLTMLLLKKTALGLYIETVGINAKAARLVGLNSTMIQFLTYAYCGLCAGIAGLIITSRVYSIDANNAGLNMELDAILAVALGGNSLGGGKFSLAGSVIGAYTIQALTTTLYAMGVSADQIPVYKAIVVVIIVSLQSPELSKIWKNAKKKIGGSARKKVA